MDVEYYLLDAEEIARVRYDPAAEEYVDAEILNEYGEWYECPLSDVLADGQEISQEEAGERARGQGGRT